jgi:hypothetical protein
MRKGSFLLALDSREGRSLYIIRLLPWGGTLETEDEAVRCFGRDVFASHREGLHVVEAFNIVRMR